MKSLLIALLFLASPIIVMLLYALFLDLRDKLRPKLKARSTPRPKTIMEVVMENPTTASIAQSIMHQADYDPQGWENGIELQDLDRNHKLATILVAKLHEERFNLSADKMRAGDMKALIARLQA